MIALDQAIPLLTATLSTVLPSPAPEAQGPSKQGGQVVAVFQLGGSKHAISRDDVALNLARRHRNSQGGKEPSEHLINVLLVEKAARKAGLMPTGEEVGTTCLFLTSTAASAITGQCMNVDCGVLPQ